MLFFKEILHGFTLNVLFTTLTMYLCKTTPTFDSSVLLNPPSAFAFVSGVCAAPGSVPGRGTAASECV